MMKLSYKNNQFPIITMNKDEHTIKLYSMVHVAPKTFYDDVYEHISKDVENGFAIHMEGVKGYPDKNIYLYKDIADVLGFITQYDLLKKIEFKIVDYTYDQLPYIDKLRIKGIRKMLDRFFENLKENEDLQKTVKDRYVDDSPIRKQTFIDKIIQGTTITTARSHHAAQQAILDDKNVSLIWGRGHNEEIVDFLIEHGYSIEKEEIISIT